MPFYDNLPKVLMQLLSQVGIISQTTYLNSSQTSPQHLTLKTSLPETGKTMQLFLS